MIVGTDQRADGMRNIHDVPCICARKLARYPRRDWERWAPPRPRPPHSRKTIQLVRFAVCTSHMSCCACLDPLEHLTRGTFRCLCATRELCGQLWWWWCVGLVLGARLGHTFVLTVGLVLLQLLGRRVGRTDRTDVNVDCSPCDNPQRHTMVRRI